MKYLVLVAAALGLLLPDLRKHRSLEELVTLNSVTLPFPQWLSDFTGLTEWPGLDPPYIPLDFVKFDTSFVPQHTQAQCEAVPNTGDVCLFDCHNCVSHEDVYLCPQLSQTFDDGPSLATPKLLRMFKAAGTRTTLFTIGLNVVRFPEIYRRASDEGHIMASHTWSHKFLPSLTNEQIVAQIQWLVWAMNATSGHLPKWFRPPYGGIDNRVRVILRQFGMQAVLWDFDTFDWKLLSGQRSEADIFNDVNTFKAKLGNRGLILEHDSMAQTVNVGIKLNQRLGKQLTVPECVGGIDYIKVFR